MYELRTNTFPSYTECTQTCAPIGKTFHLPILAPSFHTLSLSLPRLPKVSYCLYCLVRGRGKLHDMKRFNQFLISDWTLWERALVFSPCIPLLNHHYWRADPTNDAGLFRIRPGGSIFDCKINDAPG